ncbi:MAG: hypothetical protein ACO1Q7_09165 [Gemmatimonas sp.]
MPLFRQIRQGVLSAGVLVLVFADVSPAQQRTLVVRDTTGLPIPFATISVKGGAPHVTNAVGAATLNVNKDTLDVSVRRIGYREFFGKVAFNKSSSQYDVQLMPAPQALGTIDVKAKAQDLPLVQRGFYERMLDSEKGRYNGEYYTPEMLEKSSAGRVSQLLNNSRQAHVDYVGSGLPVLRGRQGCAMQIYINGQHMKGVYEGPPLPKEIKRADRNLPSRTSRGDTFTIDDLVGASEIAAIEIYPHSGNAPPAFQMTQDKGSCGVVAIWTGAR